MIPRQDASVVLCAALLFIFSMMKTGKLWRVLPVALRLPGLQNRRI